MQHLNPGASIVTRIAAVALLTPLFSSESAALDNLDFENTVESAEKMPRLYSLLISYQGDLIVEKYFNGMGANQAVNVKSVSKSVLSALVGIAIDKGYIGSVDQHIGDFFDELLAGDANTLKREITVGNLLSMQTGLETTSFYNYGAWVQSDDWIGYALQQPIQSEPGTKMHYSTGSSHLLSAIITQTTGKSTLRFAREVLGQPLGIHIPEWPTDPNGIYFGGNNMELTPRQLIIFGELYLNKGRANGKQIIPEAWVEVSLQRRIESSWRRGLYYGYGWWIRDIAGFESPYAWGFGGQFIMLVPDLKLVVVTTSNSQPVGTRRSYTRDVQSLIESQIIPIVADKLSN